MRESFNARLELDQLAWLLNIRCIDCGLFIEIADASKQPLCFVTKCIKKDNIHSQIKDAYSLTHFLIALLTTCLKMNMGAFQKLDFVCKGCEARRGFWLSNMYEKRHQWKAITCLNYQLRGGGQAWQPGTKSFFLFEEVTPSPPKKLYNESSPIPPCFLCKYEAMTTIINNTSLRKPYIPCLCQKARKGGASCQAF